VSDASEPQGTEEQPEPTFEWVLNCPCGKRLSGSSEDEIVEVSLAHLGEEHPGMEYEREHVLFMAVKFKRT
jgi:hypothetical protein